MSNPKKYLDQLFISKVRIKALKFFFLNMSEPIHLRAAVRELNEEINAVRRELSRMEEIKLLSSEVRGNRKYFKLNTDFIFFTELLGMVHKSFGLGGELVANTKKLGDIKFAVVTQGLTQGKPIGPHKLDLVLVGDIDMEALHEIVSREERKLQRDLYYTVLTLADFSARQRRKDPLVLELYHQDKVLVIGNPLDFYVQ
jgi:hypothetical protein